LSAIPPSWTRDPAVTDASVSHKSTHKVEDHLRQIVKLLEKHRLVETMVDRDRASPRHNLIESLVHRQHLVELQLKLRSLHPADIAYILEALPLDDRLLVWRQIEDGRGGEVLLEVSDAVRDSLIEIWSGRRWCGYWASSTPTIWPNWPRRYPKRS
jgi:hypothetical protein